MNKILSTLSHRTPLGLALENTARFTPLSLSSPLLTTRLFRCFSTSQPSSKVGLGSGFDINVNKNKKDSQWIYSTKHEQQLFRKAGKISMYCNIGADTHNASMRLTQHIQQSSIIVTSEPAAIHGFLSSLASKDQYCAPQPAELQSETSLVKKYSSSHIVISHEDYAREAKNLQFQSDIQVSKMIELQKQTNKERGETANAKLLKQSKQLRQFMNFKLLQKLLADVKGRQSYPFVMELTNSHPHTQSQDPYAQIIMSRAITMQEILHLQKKGLNILFLFAAEAPNKHWQSHSIQQLQRERVPYEILPCTNQLITAIVSSGLPADRFSIEVDPAENYQSLLTRRGKMKITMCIQIPTARLQQLILAIMKVLGDDHILYLHGGTEHYYRGEASGLQQHLSRHPVGEPLAYLVLSPLIPEFNQSLNKQINLENHIRNELQSDKLNAVEMEILMKKLQKFNKREEVYNIDISLMVAEMLARIQDAHIVKKCLMKLFKFRSEEWVDAAIQEGRKFVVVDYLQWQKSGAKHKKDKAAETTQQNQDAKS